jgi:hypothetical protein
MLTSRRLVLASAAIVLGLSACGSAHTTSSGAAGGGTDGSVTVTTGADAGPKVITFGTAGSGATTAASASADKMMAIRNVTYVFDGTMPTLSGSGASWQFPGGFTPDAKRVAAMAAALGVDGPVRELPADQGGGWMAGPQDYSGATLTVSADGLGSWWFNPTPATVASISACEASASDPATPVDSTDDSVDATMVTTTLAPCPEPTPPVGVPGEADALSKAKTLFTKLGYDPAGYDFEFYGDEWNANVTAYLLVDGQRTPVSMTVGFGGEGAISWASGSLATPVQGDTYPLADVQTGLDRLNDQAQQWMSVGMGYSSTVRAEGAAAGSVSGTVSEVAVPPESAVPAPQDTSVVAEPGLAQTAPAGQAPAPDMPVQCDPAADCSPVDATPVTVHLTSVKTDLTMVWDANGTVWLLPAYTFADADGGQYTVIAVTDEFLQLATPDVVIETPATEVPGTDVATTDVPVETAPLTTGDTIVSSPGTGEGAISLDAASAALVGLSEADAAAAAQANTWAFRVVQRDGVDLPITMDYRLDRVNVAVTDGKVVAVQSIG